MRPRAVAAGRVVAVVLATCVLLGALAARVLALTLAPMSLEQLTASADVVVRARCIDRQVTRTPDGRIESRARFTVVESAKGAPPDVVVVRQLGGRLDDTELIVPGAPLSEAGDDVVLFLASSDDAADAMGVVGLALGYLPVAVLPGAGASVQTSRALGGSFAPGGTRSVAELLQRVRDIDAGSAR